MDIASVGGENTHSVVSGTGDFRPQLFTDLDKMVVGDTFIIRFDEILTYEVDQIRIVLPTELNDLKIEKNKDYMTS